MRFSDKTLRAFVAAADSGSIGRAAEIVGLSQPAVSRTISELELSVGQKLFERHSKGVYLTAAGDTLLPYARHLLFESQQAADALGELGGLKRGVLRLGVNSLAGRSFVLDRINALLEDRPGVTVEIIEEIDNVLFSHLRKRAIDLAIGSTEIPGEGIGRVGQLRTSDTFKVICASDHPLLQRLPVRLSEALSYPWAMPSSGTEPRERFKKLLAELGYEMPWIPVETSHAALAAATVSRTACLAWLPTGLFRSELASGSVKVIPLPELDLPVHLYLYSRGHGLMPPLARRLLSILTEDLI